MTPEQASSLAARTLAAIDAQIRADKAWNAPFEHLDADRARVASDLAGLHLIHGVRGTERISPAVENALVGIFAHGLILTGSLYGVTP